MIVMVILKGISWIYFIRKLIIIFIIDTKEGASSLTAAPTIAESSAPDEEQQQSVVNHINWVSKDQIIDGTRVPLKFKKIKLIKIIEDEIKKDYIIFCFLFVYLLFSAFGLFQWLKWKHIINWLMVWWDLQFNSND